MRVLQVATCPFPAGRGSPLLIERIAQGLIARGHRVDTLAPPQRERGRAELVPILRAARTRGPVSLVPGSRELDSSPRLGRVVHDAALAIRCLRQAPDVIVGHNLDGGWIAALAGRARGIPSVYVRHSSIARELSLYGPFPAVAYQAGRLLERAVRALATRTVALSCLDGADTIPAPGDPDEAAIAPADGHTLYYEGNLDRYQNPEWLERTLEAARRVEPRIRLLCASGPAERPGAADLALVPRSLPGGFPMKLLAYQLAGIPAICVESGAPGMVDGLDAFVVPGHGSPEAFAARTLSALASPAERRALAGSARARARARNAPDAIARRWEETLERTISRSRAGPADVAGR